MRTALEVDSKTATKLLKLAEAQHVSVEELLAAHVPGLAADQSIENASSEDPERAFEEWIADFPKDTPLLLDDAITRASIYGDR